MVEVSRTEAELIRKTFKGEEGKITRTMVQKSSRGKCYVAEYPKVMEFIKQLRKS